MQVKCKTCGKEYNIKDEFIKKADLKMRCRGCGEVIVVKKLDAGEPAPLPPSAAATPQPPSGKPIAPPVQETKKDDTILPVIKDETSGMDEFDLDSSPITVPPPKKKGTIIGQAVPPPPPVKPPAPVDAPFADLPGGKDVARSKPDSTKPPQFARDMEDLPVPKEKGLEASFDFAANGAPAPGPPRPKADLPAVKAGPSIDEDLGFTALPVPARPAAQAEDSEFKTGSGADFEKAPREHSPRAYDRKDLDGMKTPLQVPSPGKTPMQPLPIGDTPIPPVLSPSSLLPRARDTRKEVDESFGSLDLPKKETVPGGPMAKEPSKSVDDIFGSLGMPPKEAPLPMPKKGAAAAAEAAAGEFESDSLDVERSKKFLGQAGGTSFGEIDLGETPEAPKSSLEGAVQERVDLPERKRVPALGAEAPGEEALVDLDDGSVQQIERQRAKAKVAVKEKAVPAGWKMAKGGKGLVYVLLLLIAAGGGVAVWRTGTTMDVYKAFSKYMLGEDIDAYFAARDRVIADVSARLKDDRYADYKQGIGKLKQLIERNRKDRYLAAYTSYLASSMELRFGKETAVDKLGESLLNQVSPENDFPLTFMLATSSQKLLRRLDAKKVLSALLAQEQQHPQDRDILVLAALGCLAAGEGGKAVTLYKKLAALEGNSRRSRYGLIRATFLEGDDKTGEELLGKFIEEFPDFIEAKVLKARRYVKLGSISQAGTLIESIGKEGKLDPFLDVSVKAIGGMIHLRNEQVQDAKVIFGEILKTNPMNLDALLGMAEIDLYEENPTRALGRYTVVLGMDPRSDEALFGTVRCQIQLSQFKEAKVLLVKLEPEYREDYRLYFFLAQLAVGLGDEKEAEKQFRTAMEKKPTHLDSYLDLASLYFKQGRNMDAINMLEEARKNLPLTAKLLTAFATGHVNRGEYDKALEELAEAVKKDPAYIHARFTMGVTLYHLKRYDEALEQLETVAKTNPAYPGLVLYQGLIFEAKGEPEKALAYYGEAMKTSPDDENVLLRTVAIYVGNGKFSQAKPLVEKVLAKNPGNAEAIYYFGRVLLGQNQNGEALHHFERAIKLSPNTGLYYLWGGLASEIMGNFPDALHYSEKAIERDPNIAEAYLLRGKLKVRMGLVKDGKADLKKVLDLSPNMSDAWGPMGMALEEERSFGEALAAYRKYLDKRTDDFEIHARAGLILFDRGELGEAKKHFQSAADVAREKAPESKWRFTALYYLGRIEEKEGNKAKAVLYYEDYMKFAPLSSIDRDDVQVRLQKLKMQ